MQEPLSIGASHHFGAKTSFTRRGKIKGEKLYLTSDWKYSNRCLVTFWCRLWRLVVWQQAHYFAPSALYRSAGSIATQTPPQSATWLRSFKLFKSQFIVLRPSNTDVGFLATEVWRDFRGSSRRRTDGQTRVWNTGKSATRRGVEERRE